MRIFFRENYQVGWANSPKGSPTLSSLKGDGKSEKFLQKPCRKSRCKNIKNNLQLLRLGFCWYIDRLDYNYNRNALKLQCKNTINMMHYNMMKF